MLAYGWQAMAGLAVQRAGAKNRLHWIFPRHGPGLGVPLGAAMCLLLLILNVEEIYFKLPYYQRRINDVSDCLAGVGSAIAKDGGDAAAGCTGVGASTDV